VVAQLGRVKPISRKFASHDMAAERIVLDAAEVVDLGLRYHLQGYDVVYLELARRLGVPVATLDGGMRTACETFRVKLV
jgi:predicted nucleic acid-binding protein